MLETAGQEGNSWILQMFICDRSPTTPPVPEGFSSLEFVYGCCPLAPAVTSWLLENSTDSCFQCFFHILCFFRLPHSLSFSFYLLTPIQHCTCYLDAANHAVPDYPAPWDFSPCPWSEAFTGAGLSH